MRSIRLVWDPWLLFVVFGLSGCGSDDSMAKVAGTVTLDGQPVEAGAILFVPVDGTAQTTGGEIKDGRYSVRVPPGAMKVSITAPKVIGKKKIYPTPDSPEMPVTVEAIPGKYNEQTELTIEVTSGANEKKFDLQSR